MVIIKNAWNWHNRSALHLQELIYILKLDVLESDAYMSTDNAGQGTEHADASADEVIIVARKSILHSLVHLLL